jgi:DNA-binding MarR family transcriptional regulator
MSPVPPKKSRTSAPPVNEGPGAEAVNPLSLDAQLCFLLYSSTHAMVKVYKPVLDELGLTYPQYLVMLLLWEAEGWTVNALGDRLGLDSGTLTPLLRRMATKGLLTRTRDLADERRVQVNVSEAGLALKARAGIVPEAMRCALGLEDAELQAMRATLADLQRRLKLGAIATSR